MEPARNFDVEALRLKGITALVARVVGNPSQRVYGILRRWLPNLRLPQYVYFTKYLPVPIPRFWVLVTRYEDVDEVLSRNDVFKVPWSAETKLLNDGHENGTNFILGLDGERPEEGGGEYDWQLAQVMHAFRREDVATIVVPVARDAATSIVDRCGGRLDAVEKLVTAVPLTICQSYYGVTIPAPLDFTHWTIAMSGYLFGPPFDRPRIHETVLAGADRTRAVVDAAIELEIRRAREDPDTKSATVLQRLAREHCRDPGKMTRLIIGSFLMGMIVGFVPTNTVAGGHILEMLLSRRDFLEAAQAAAQAGDDDLLARTLFEAMRFMPLNPGPWRQCARDYTIAAGTWRATRIRKGRYVVAGTQSAMFDPRQVGNPNTFDPGRDASDSMLFGYRLHWCAGIHIARAQITQTLKPLLLRRNLRRAPGKAGTLQLLGLFPEHLEVVFDD